MKTKAKIMLMVLLVSGGYVAQNMCGGTAHEGRVQLLNDRRNVYDQLVAALERNAPKWEVRRLQGQLDTHDNLTTGNPAAPSMLGKSLGYMWNNPGTTVLGVAGLIVLHGMYINKNLIAQKINKMRGVLPLQAMNEDGTNIVDAQGNFIAESFRDQYLGLAWDIVWRAPRASFIALVNAKNDFATWRNETWKWAFPPKQKEEPVGHETNAYHTVVQTRAEAEAAKKQRKAEAAAKRRG